jgi:excisionase family DNA binding protein
MRGMSAAGYISTTDAADRLGITRQRVLQLIVAGRLPASLFANVYMIREADLKLVEDRSPGRPPKAKTSTEKSSGPDGKIVAKRAPKKKSGKK